MKTNEIKTSTVIDNEGGIIAFADTEAAQCVYDGDQYTGRGADDEDMRYAARVAWEKRFQDRK